jgi:hypothetical protein
VRRASNAEGGPLRVPGWLDRGDDRLEAREERDARVVDHERVVAAERPGAARLHHLEGPAVAALVAFAAQRQDDVADGLLGVAGALARVALDEDQGGRAQDGQLRPQRVEEVRGRLVVGQEPAHAPEPVEHDQRGVLVAGGRDDRVLGLGRPFPQQVGQAAELELLADHRRREEAEPAAVGDQLIVRLRVAGEVEHRGAPRGDVEGDLLGEDRLTGTRRSDDHRDRSRQDPAAQDAVEVGDTRL